MGIDVEKFVLRFRENPGSNTAIIRAPKGLPPLSRDGIGAPSAWAASSESVRKAVLEALNKNGMDGFGVEVYFPRSSGLSDLTAVGVHLERKTSVRIYE